MERLGEVPWAEPRVEGGRLMDGGLPLAPLLFWVLPLYPIREAASEVGWMMSVKDGGLTLGDNLSPSSQL